VTVENAGASVAPSSAIDTVDPVQRQILRRAVNEQIRAFARRLSLAGEIDLVCECDLQGCGETIRVSAIVYEDVRRFPTRFLVKPGHVAFATDRAVVEADPVVVVEKTRPDDAEASIRADPRRKRTPAEPIDPADP
jgi:hypothetical protein